MSEEAKKSKSAVFFQRALSTSVLWIGVIFAIVFVNEWLLFGIIALLSLAALGECLRMFSGAFGGRYQVWTVTVAVGYLAATFLGLRDGAGRDFTAIALALLLGGLFTLSLVRKLEGRDTLWQIVGCTFAFVYAVVLFGFMLRILYITGDVAAGVFLVLYTVAVTKCTDIGAYCIGSLIGRHKMIPHISPGKTWQGFAGGLFVAQIASHGLIAAFPERLDTISHLHGAILGLVIAIVTVVADLAGSVLKRCCEVKDSGHFLPGIGGAVDLIDSPIFTGPLVYMYFHLVLR